MSTYFTQEQSEQLRNLDHEVNAFFQNDARKGFDARRVVEANDEFAASLPVEITQWVRVFLFGEEEDVAQLAPVTSLGDNYEVSAAYVIASAASLDKAKSLNNIITIQHELVNDLSDLRSWSRDWDAERGVWKR